MRRFFSAIVLISFIINCNMMVVQAETGPGSKTQGAREYLGATALDEQIVADLDGTKVTVQGLGYQNNNNDVSVDIRFDNESGKDWVIKFDEFYINDIGNLNPHQTNLEVLNDTWAEAAYLQPVSYFYETGIEHIQWIDFTFSIYNKADGKVILDKKAVHLETSMMGQYEQSYDFPGRVIYDVNGIKVILGEHKTENKLGKGIPKFIINSSDQNVIVSLMGKEINGTAASSDNSHLVKSGKIEYCSYTLTWEGIAKFGTDETDNRKFDVIVKTPEGVELNRLSDIMLEFK